MSLTTSRRKFKWFIFAETKDLFQPTSPPNHHLLIRTKSKTIKFCSDKLEGLITLRKFTYLSQIKIKIVKWCGKQQYVKCRNPVLFCFHIRKKEKEKVEEIPSPSSCPWLKPNYSSGTTSCASHPDDDDDDETSSVSFD